MRKRLLQPLSSSLVLFIFLTAYLTAPASHQPRWNNSRKKKSASTLSEAAPESVGMSTPRAWAELMISLKNILTKNGSREQLSLWQEMAKIVYYKGLGYDDIDKKTPMKKDAICRIASQTKAITSVAVMMLYEEGKILLSDPVSKYIPEFKNPKVLDKFNAADTTYTTVPAKRELTIRDLLTHTSGIGYAQIGSKESNAIYYKAGVVGGIGVDKIRVGRQNEDPWVDCRLCTSPEKNGPMG
jgi:CubicO group peptidase (beta-lactamase class C family)